MCGSWLCKMKEILSISIPLFPKLLGFSVAACFENISSSNLKLSVNCCDDRSPLYTGSAQSDCSVLERKLLHTNGAFTPYVRVGRYTQSFSFSGNSQGISSVCKFMTFCNHFFNRLAGQKMSGLKLV